MKPKLQVTIFSFSYHLTGIPIDNTGHNGGFVFDCRFLPNPGRNELFASLTGNDRAVVEYFQTCTSVKEFLYHVFAIIDVAVENYIERGFEHLLICFGCTGGQHRSVYCAEQLADHLQKFNIEIKLEHIELGNFKK